MRVQDIMSRNPACSGADATVQEAARLMVERDCGEIPLVDANRKPLGVVTDRDIAARVVAEGAKVRRPGYERRCLRPRSR